MFLRKKFPIINWLPHYPRQVKNWLPGDILSSFTVSLLLIPQALAYAKLAGLPLAHGLYTSLTGLVLYMFFATSKDVTIGPTAVISQLSGQLLASYNSGYDPVTFSISVALVAGIFELALGLLQLGLIVDFISSPVIAGFTTGAAVTIIIAQLPGLLGVTGINTNNPSYQVLFDTFSNIKRTTIDSSIGFSCLLFLILWKLTSREFVKRGYKFGTLFGQAGYAASLVLFTIIAYSVNLTKPTIKVVGPIPSGLTYLRAPTLSYDLFLKVLPASATIVLVSIMEHIAVTKSFGRVNGYVVDPNQEIVALGLTNIFGTFFGAFSSTGSFSRSAVKSRSGVNTPLSCLFTAILLIISIFALTGVFQHIPSASLSAVIIYAITDLISRPHVIRGLWNVSLTDFISFWVALLVTIFSSIEIGIYSSVSFSLLVLLYRIARPDIQFLVKKENYWIPLDEAKDDNVVKAAPPGILVFRVEESLTYPNSNHVNEQIKNWIYAKTLRGKPNSKRSWSDRSDKPEGNFADAWLLDDAPPPKLLGAVIDFSAVNSIDATGLQCLVDIRRDLEKQAGSPVPLVFAHVKPRLSHIIHQFHRIVDPSHQVTPAVNEQTAFNPRKIALLKDVEENRERLGCHLIHETIDEAVQKLQFESQQDNTLIIIQHEAKV